MATFLEEVARLNQAYKEDARNQSYKALVYGPSGSGKTFSCRTARLPLMVHSFDPGGSKVLSDLVAEGRALINTSFESENPKDPKAFAAWDDHIDALVKMKAFDNIGTLVIDSVTTFSQCAMYAILKKVGRQGQVPHQQDWYPAMNLVELAVRKLFTLPCDVILLAHDAADKDEISGSITRAPLFVGKLTTRIPVLFDEVYYSYANNTSKGTEYLWQLKKDRQNVAKSRLTALATRRKQVIEGVMPQDFKAIIGKAGYSTEDKPLFVTTN